MIAANIYQLILAKHNLSMGRVIRDSLLCFGILTVLLILGGFQNGSYTMDGVIGLFAIAMGVIAIVELGGNTFDEFKNTRSAYQWVTLPTTQFEKWSANFITSFFLVPVIALLIFLASTVVANIVLAIPSMAGPLPIFNPLSGEAWILLKAYWFVHPILFFAAIYFKKRPAIKLAGTASLLFLAWILFTALVGDMLLGNQPEPDFTQFEHLEMLRIGPFEISEHGVEFHKSLMSSLVINLACITYFAYFWGLSFLRLKELEL